MIDRWISKPLRCWRQGMLGSGSQDWIVCAMCHRCYSKPAWHLAASTIQISFFILVEMWLFAFKSPHFLRQFRGIQLFYFAWFLLAAWRYVYEGDCSSLDTTEVQSQGRVDWNQNPVYQFIIIVAFAVGISSLYSFGVLLVLSTLLHLYKDLIRYRSLSLYQCITKMKIYSILKRKRVYRYNNYARVKTSSSSGNASTSSTGL